MDAKLLGKIANKNSIYPISGNDLKCFCEDIIRTDKLLLIYTNNKSTGKTFYFWMYDPKKRGIRCNFVLDRCHKCVIGAVGRTEDGILFTNNYRYESANTVCRIFKRLV